MNKRTIFLCMAVLLPLNFSLYAAAQESTEQNQITFLWAESIIRNSENQLVAYAENFRIKIVSLESFNQIIDVQKLSSKAKVVTTEIFEKEHEWITISDTITYDQETVHGMTALGDVVDGVPRQTVFFLNDGYAFSAGDQLKVTWVVARPLD